MSADPISEKTQAIRDIQQELQDVTETVRQIREILEEQKAERSKWKTALYRILKESISLLFSEKQNGKNNRQPTGEGADDLPGKSRTTPHIRARRSHE